MDYKNLPKDIQDKLLKWEANSPTNKQVQILSDIADISQEMLGLLDDQKKVSKEQIGQLGAVLVDMREALQSLNAKEAPEAPDTSKPVIDAISKLEKALTGSIKAIDVKPVVNVPENKAPIVNVDAPVVNVDNKELSKILKTDLPKAFNDAIKSIVIPENDDAETNQLLQELAIKLDSIDVGVRLKPQAPDTIKVTNPDGSNVGGATTWGTNDIEDDTTSYFGQTTASGTWRILKLTDTSVSYATESNNGSVTSYTDAWTDRATLTYGRYDEAF